MIKLIIILNFFLIINYCNAYIVDPGPVVIATKGEVWPKPKEQITEETFSIVRPMVLHFEPVNHTCDILNDAILRYTKIIRQMANPLKRKFGAFNATSSYPPRLAKSWRTNSLYEGNLDIVNINLRKKCEHMPYHGMDESYTFVHRNNEATIESFSIWGILRGLETFSQMLYLADDNRSLIIKTTEVTDEPRFPHRGLLLDTSRHFMNLFTIFQVLNGMEYNKLNVFHWHIVDDHSFPYESKIFPELSEKGTFHPSMSYSQEDIKNVIEYARVRGIRVMSEFDTPGHTRSWGVSHPEILTECGGNLEGKLGPINPIKPEVYVFLQKLFKEIVEVFPEKYVHLGGDEVGFECWESNKEIVQYMNDNNITTFNMLEEEYIQKIVDQVRDLNASSMVWQEVYQNGVRLPPGTVVHIWTGDQRQLLGDITKNGLPALLSTCWYLDHLSTGGDWTKFYNCEPHDFPGNEVQKNLVLGGEACMWAETVDDSNVLQRIFPRVSASAEKLWSQYNVNSIEEAKKRLEEHYCRMRIRGIPAQPPNGPGYCV